MTETTAAFEFPLVWRGKIIAQDSAEIEAAINRILDENGSPQKAVRGRASNAGKYITYNVGIVFMDRPMMDRVIAAFAAIEGVKLVL